MGQIGREQAWLLDSGMNSVAGSAALKNNQGKPTMSITSAHFVILATVPGRIAMIG
jgi:hypothetical protein